MKLLYNILYTFILSLVLSSLPFGEGWGGAFAQTYPVQLSTNLVPPYSGYLPDYADPSAEKLKVILQFNDFTVAQYNVRLKLEIKGNGFTLTTKQLYNPPPLQIEPGVPFLLSGADLAPYLNSNNLDFVGINQSQYEQRMALPEGYYTICVKAYDYYNNGGNLQVSNEACAQAWFTLSDPPFLNVPFCNASVTPQTPQNMVFQWTPMNLGSPNSAFNTEYDFELWECRPDTNANPNQIVLSTAPIFSITTQQTVLNYGMVEPALNLYMKYVWRVRARDISGRDLFKNQGYSQICTFNYGSLANVLGSALTLNLTAQGITHRMGKCTWNTQSLFTNYKLQVRKQGTTNWFDYNTTQGSEKVTNLEPYTDYEAQVQGSGNGVTSAWSNMVVFRTNNEPNYNCNDQTQLADPLQAQPLPLNKAVIGLVIQTGQFEVITTQISATGSPGWYSGKGYARVFGVLPLAVQWSNIYIDDNNRHQQGIIQAMTKGIDSWVHQWDVTNAQNDPEVVNGTITSFTVTNGQYCYTLQGSTQQVCDSFPSGKNVFVVHDDSGNEYTVNTIPPPPTVTGPTNYIVTSPDNMAACDSLMVTFEPSQNQAFGFDKKEYTAHIPNYECIKLSNSTNYFVPYKSIGETQTDEVLANIQINNFKHANLSFKTFGGTALTSTSITPTQYKITGIPATANCVYAYYNNKKVGKLNIVSLKPITKKVVIVPVNSASNSITASQLNAIYKQANVAWTVTTASAFNFSLGNDGLEAADATLLAKYSAGMRALRDAYKQANSNYDKDAYYIFVVPNFSNAQLKGYMVRGRAIGFVTANATAKELAHELAHGAFGLEHTFPKIDKETSNNLLDYGNGEKLTNEQWMEMQNPSLILNWNDGEEDGSLLVFENAKVGDFIFDDDFKISKYTAVNYAPIAVNNEFLEIVDGSGVLFYVFQDGGAKVYGIEDKVKGKTYFWDNGIRWYKDKNGIEYDNWWAYDILNAGSNVVRPLVMLAGGDPQGCAQLKTAYANYNGSGGLAGFVGNLAVDGIAQLFTDLKAGGHVRSQALLTLWYSPLGTPSTGLAASIVGGMSSKLAKVGIKLGGKTLQTWTFNTVLNIEIFKFNFQSLNFTFKNSLIKNGSIKRVLYKLENISYNTDLDNVFKSASIELVEDVSGNIGWRVIQSFSNVLDDAFLNMAKAFDDNILDVSSVGFQNWKIFQNRVAQQLQSLHPGKKIGNQITLDVTYIENGITKTKTIIPDNLIQIEVNGVKKYKVIDAKTAQIDLVNKPDLTSTCTQNQQLIYKMIDGDATAGTITKVEMRGGQAQSAFGADFPVGQSKMQIQLESNVEFWVNSSTTDFTQYLIRPRIK